jgi:hypothetical protein
MTKRILGFLAACGLCAAAPLDAQENRAWPERAFVTVDVPFQLLNNDFSESLSFADTARRTENVTFVSDYASTRGAVFDVGAGVRLAKSIGVGVAASWFRRSSSGSFDLKIPSPIAANSPLEVTGSVSDLRRRELGIHIRALYALPLGSRARVMLSGGPSVFQVKQDLVKSIQFEVLPGFASLTFDQAFVTTVERTVVGFNLGADVTWAIASHFGIGAVTRYSRAKATLDPGGQSSMSRAIEMHVGGLHIGGGIQLRF